MALDLAGNTNRSIVCLYVKPTSVNSVKYGELFNDEENRLMRIAFDFAQKECKKHNVKFIDETVTGDAKSGIVKYANDSSRKIDLLVMGARGRGSGIDHTQLTREQLDRWGVRYHELEPMFHKPTADLFIDDKGINSEEWKKTVPPKRGIIAGAFGGAIPVFFLP